MEEEIHADSKNELTKYILGIPIILLIIVDAIGQSEYTQYASKKISFSSNFFLCWFTQAWLLVSLPIGVFFDLIRFYFLSLKNSEHKFSFKSYFHHLNKKIHANPNFSW